MADETRPLLAQDENAPAPHSYSNSTSNASPEARLNGGYSQGELEDVDGNSKVRILTILFPLSIGVFLSAMDGTVVAASYASIGSDLKQLQNMSWVATGYLLTLTSFQPLYGKLSDIFGRKSCYLFACSVFGLGCLACGLARSMTELIAARVFTGIGGAGMSTVVTILISDIVPLRQRGMWQGIMNVVFALGSAIGAPLGGILTDSIGWRWVFLFQFPLTFVSIFSVLPLKLPTRVQSALPISAKFRRIDFLGALTLLLAISSLLLGLDRGGNTGWASPLAYGPLIASLVFTLIFALVESTPRLAAEPIAPKHIITNASLLGSYLTNFFGFGSMVCAFFHVSLYAQAVRGKSASEAGLTLIPAIIVGISGSLLSGYLMQRTGKYYWLIVFAQVCTVAGTVVIDYMAAASISGSMIGVAGGLVGVYFGTTIMVTATITALIANVTQEDQAVATAVNFLFRSLGGVVGISIGSALVQNTLRVYLMQRLTGSKIDVEEIVRRVRESLSYVDTLDPATRAVVRGSYEEALKAAFWVSTTMAACSVLSSVFIREKGLGGAK